MASGLIRFYKNFLAPTGLLVGTIIGAGIFALPYTFKISGLAVGFFYLIVATVVYCLIHLFYADIIMRTPGEHRFAGYAKIYLGRSAFWLAAVTSVLEMIFVMTIYLLLATSFLNLVFAFTDPTLKLLLFWGLASIGIFLSLRKLALVEFLISWSMAALVILLFIFGAGHLGKITVWDFQPNMSNIIMPLAPILFALGGRVGIPPLVKYFKMPGLRPRWPSGPEGIGHQSRLLKRAIIAGTVIPAIVYCLFVLGILGLSQEVSQDSVSGLIGQVSPALLIILGIFGILALWSSYIGVGLDVSSTLLYDFKFPRLARLLSVVVGPLALYFFGPRNFINLVSLTGGIFLALEGIFIVLMWLVANRCLAKKSELLNDGKLLGAIAAVAVFLIAFGYKLIKIF